MWTSSPAGTGALEATAPVFAALGDERRLRLLARLGGEGPLSIARLSEGAGITRQAVTKHLQVLADAGLVTPQRYGREVRYAATPDPLGPAVGWLVAAGAQWDRRLERLRQRFER